MTASGSTVLPTHLERQQGPQTVTRSQSRGPGTADGRGRRCKEVLVHWLVGPDTVDRWQEGDFQRRRVVLQTRMRRPMGLVEARGTEGLANTHPHRCLQWLRLEKHRNQSIRQ